MTRIVLRPRAIAGLKGAPPPDRVRLTTALDILRQGLFPPHTKRLEGVSASADGGFCLSCKMESPMSQISFSKKDAAITVAVERDK